MRWRPPSSYPPGRQAVPHPPQQHKHWAPNEHMNPTGFLPHQFPNFVPQITPFAPNPYIHSQFQHLFPNAGFSDQILPGNDASQNFLSDDSWGEISTKNDEAWSEMVLKIEKAVSKAWADLLESNEYVSAWKVSKAALLMLNSQSWRSLKYIMQQVPSLKRLVKTEWKVNAFILCFTAVQKITSLYDLEIAICESEGVNRFEELELGPLFRHPIAVKYFSLSSDVTRVYTIRTEQIISYLHEYIKTHQNHKLKVRTFLDFISDKESVSSSEKLCIRIQNFRSFVDHIKQVESKDRRQEGGFENMRFESVIEKHDPLFIDRKKEIDINFNEITQRVKSFSSSTAQFCGKHVRFSSPSSDGDSEKENLNDENTESNRSYPMSNAVIDCASSCPYPSATEEMTRLRMKNVDSNRGSHHEDKELPQRKRVSTSYTLPHEQSERGNHERHPKRRKSINHTSNSSLFYHGSWQMFCTTWTEACKANNADEVLEMMLQFYNYNTRKKAKVKKLFNHYPFSGLLMAAVTFIKSGMLNDPCAASLALNLEHVDNKSPASSDSHRSIGAVELGANSVVISLPQNLCHKPDVVAEDVLAKISGYFENDVISCKVTPIQHKFQFLRKLYKSLKWLTEQYSVDDFEDLGHGDYFMFLEKYMHRLPRVLQFFFTGDGTAGVSLEAHLLPIQLDVLLSQALNCSDEDETISLQTIIKLLATQFPLAGFKLVNGFLTENVLGILQERKCNLTSGCVLFSAPLLRLGVKGNTLAQTEENKTGKKSISDAENGRAVTPVTTTEAIQAVLKAPMLTDLSLWLHWDSVFAPSLGSLIEWLLKEVKSRDFLCLVTKEGKAIRISHLASIDSLMKVFIQGSSYGTAVELLSLVAMYGGIHKAPLLLLKSHAERAFELLINDYLVRELKADRNTIQLGCPPNEHDVVLNITSANSVMNSSQSTHKKVASIFSRFILDCLSHLPVEFCCFAADIMIAGLQAFVMDAPKVILTECKDLHQRLMLHEVGITLGITDWVLDYYSFSSSASAKSFWESSRLTGLHSRPNAKSTNGKDDPDCHLSSSDGMLVSHESDDIDSSSKEVSDGADASQAIINNEDSQGQFMHDYHFCNDPAMVVDTIRKEEFGLDHCSSAAENKMLEKQHARLGRALHCLSQELYSHDSHFILELVQNADDNIYTQNLVPTLVFILQEKAIIMLNNEKGFSDSDVRALCDVGNSTKRNRKDGFIGKKGIGFKSVFKVTDSPEIHSNGFHIKFDTTKGPIGFVLPTVVPPCDIQLYARLASANDDFMDQNLWHTCILLPLKSSLSEFSARNNILSMFSDLHPSLLLFLRRLQCIKFRNMLDDTYTVMRKEVRGDGIVHVSVGDYKMTWFVANHQLKPNAILSDFHQTEISVAFTLKELGQGEYAPVLDQQPVFAFLPLRMYGLKFILQGDFVLPSSREEVDVNSVWNQWLLSEVPDLFGKAQRLFCDLPCYKECPGKAVNLFMKFVPMVGEVHGFFSSLPRIILSKLRLSNCLVLEGDKKEWVPPCKALRNWDDRARSLLPDSLLQERLGLGLLDKDIVLSDSLARALGVEEYGPKLLLRVLSSLCSEHNGLNSLGLRWLSSLLDAIHAMLSSVSSHTSSNFDDQTDFIQDLRKISFIPLADGTYSSLNENVIWLHCDGTGQSSKDEFTPKYFPKLFAELRFVNPKLLDAASLIESSCSGATVLENVTGMLHKVGIQRLSAHDILKMHVLPALSHDNSATEQEGLMVEYLAFAMFHLLSSCTSCGLEREDIVVELQRKALILTNFGYKRLSEVPIHFGVEYGNAVQITELISGLDMKWHEIESAYLKHPITHSTSDGILKWRKFLQEIGASDFVQVVQVEKEVSDMSLLCGEDWKLMKSVKDWESEELLCLLSMLSLRNNGHSSEYLLEILDMLWDDYFKDKVTGSCIYYTGESKPFKSSFIRNLQDFPWISSAMSGKLNYPKELYHDCIAVNSILGVSAPYAVPKVRSENLIAEIGLKTEVTLDGALSVLRLWRSSETPLKASVSQMSNFYSFIWKGMIHSKNKVVEELHLGPFIFIPNATSYSFEDVVSGRLFSPQDVYWHDVIHFVDHVRWPHCEAAAETECHFRKKKLCDLYANLHVFFVNECGVDEKLPLCSYLQILQHLSKIALPHEVAKKVFEVFTVWGDALKSGSLSSQDIDYLKENLLKEECTVLPTKLDRWVSLHSSFGLICWCDDDGLRKEFEHLEGVDFLYFGKSCAEKTTIPGNVSSVMRILGIPALSEIVTREPICDHPMNFSLIHSLVKWILPYAQRYIYNSHAERYFQLKESNFSLLRQLNIVVVDKLFYRNVIKRCGLQSKKRTETDCLHQGHILYCTPRSDPHSIFMELSCLLFSDSPDLAFANFLHIITTMGESGSTEEQIEAFILNCQKVPKLHTEECSWSLLSTLLENDGEVSENCVDVKFDGQKPAISWRTGITSVDSRTDRSFSSPVISPLTQPESSSLQEIERNITENALELACSDPEAKEISESKPNIIEDSFPSDLNTLLDSVDLASSDLRLFAPSIEQDQSLTQQILLTGKLGELVAYRYFVEKAGEASVTWVNEDNETGLPFDIVIDGENEKEYIEVKATKSTNKSWFYISMREWEFAAEKGEAFSIAHVVLGKDNMAKITIYRNPATLCWLGNLKLAAIPINT